jgi:hypothetical protein
MGFWRLFSFFLWDIFYVRLILLFSDDRIWMGELLMAVYGDWWLVVIVFGLMVLVVVVVERLGLGGKGIRC